MGEHLEPPPGSDDDLRAENEVLKLKLQLDHGMQSFGPVISPKAENEWLKSVYDFEVTLKDAREITIYDLIGRPPVKRWYTLKREKITTELRKILALLEKNGIALKNLDRHDDVRFYQMITEEFLPRKFGEFSRGPFMPPMTTWVAKEDD